MGHAHPESNKSPICIENDFGFMCASRTYEEKNTPGIIQVFCDKIAAILSEGFWETSSFKQALKTHLFKSAYNTPPTPTPTPPVRVCVCTHVCAISHCTFLYLQYIYLYHTCVLKSEFGHVWLLTTLVYLLKLLYVNSCMDGGHMARNLFYFVHCICLCIFLQLFVQRIVP